MKTLKFLKLFENFIILNTCIFFLNHMKFLKVLKFYENLEFLNLKINELIFLFFFIL